MYVLDTVLVFHCIFTMDFILSQFNLVCGGASQAITSCSKTEAVTNAHFVDLCFALISTFSGNIITI